MKVLLNKDLTFSSASFRVQVAAADLTVYHEEDVSNPMADWSSW